MFERGTPENSRAREIKQATDIESKLSSFRGLGNYHIPGVYIVESGGPPIPSEGWWPSDDSNKVFSPESICESFEEVMKTPTELGG